MFPIQSNTDDSKLYVDDVFSTYLYTGNGSTQTITNGIDLAGKGGMVWIKCRSNGGTATYDHRLLDTSRGAGNYLSSATTDAQTNAAVFSSFNSNGFSLNGSTGAFNSSTLTYASWTFRKSPKFFDVVTWTGDGGTQTISHSLGQVPGMIIVKDTSSGTTDGWYVWHRGLTSGNYILLNQTAAQTTSSAKYIFGNNTITVDPTSSQFTVGANTAVNGAVGHTYVALLFADDPSADGIIQCGSVSGTSEVNLGWEPQYVLTKRTDSAEDWFVWDSMRGMTVAGVNDQTLRPNTSGAETTDGAIGITATGFAFNLTGSRIYLAIRRPNKPPTSGTQVFAPDIGANVSAGAPQAYDAGFPVDLELSINRGGGTDNAVWIDRLRGGSNYLASNSTAAEAIGALRLFDSMTGVKYNGTFNFTNYCGLLFRRAPGFFDVVCYTGTGVARTVSHNLGVAPELMIVKERNSTSEWPVYAQPIGNDRYLLLNANNAQSAIYSGTWNSTPPTATVFSLGTDIDVNTNNNTYVACLFATLPGISKVGSYTGNGTSQTIDCGFSTGARFILIKRTDSTGDWYVWDSARGIIAGNDPHLSLNTTAAEVTTDDSVDPDNSGFIVNQVAATNINVTSATYIYLAIA